MDAVGESRRQRGGPRAIARVLGQRNYGPYFAGNVLSASGTWFQNLAAALLVYRLTHSKLLLGVLGFAQFAPLVVLIPWTGAAADRFNRRRLIVAMNLVSAALAGTLAALAWAGAASTAAVFVVSVGLGTAFAFWQPAASALVPSLVEREDLVTAVALGSMSMNLARAVGPALGGVTVETLGIPAAFAINAASFFALVAGVLLTRPRPRAGGTPRSVSLRESLALFRADPVLLGLVAVSTAVSFSADPINTLAPAFARAFGRPDTDAGYLIGIFGAGAVTAALVVSGRRAGGRLHVAATLALEGLGLALFAAIPSLWVAAAFLFVGGIGYLASNTAATTTLQLRVADWQRGRVMAIWGAAFLGVRPLASLIDGTIADLSSVRAAGVALAALAVAAAAALAWSSRGARRE